MENLKRKISEKNAIFHERNNLLIKDYNKYRQKISNKIFKMEKLKSLLLTLADKNVLVNKETEIKEDNQDTSLRKEKRDKISNFLMKQKHDQILAEHEFLDYEVISEVINQYKKEMNKSKTLEDELLKMHLLLTESRNKIITENIKLCYHTNKSKNGSSPAQKQNKIINNEGVFGLMVAIDKFDPSKGFQFATYATHWINHYIKRFMQNNHGLIRVPVNVQDKKEMLKKGKILNEKALKRIADANFYIESFNQVYEKNGDHISLEEKISSDMLSTEDIVSLNDSRLNLQKLSDKVADIIKNDLKIPLTPIHEKILKDKIFNLSPKSIDDLSYELHKTADTIRKAEVKLLQLMTTPSIKKLVLSEIN